LWQRHNAFSVGYFVEQDKAKPDVENIRGMNSEVVKLTTPALVAGEWSASLPGGFPPGKELPVPIVYEVGWTPEPVWTT
jgi:hypothetical protein